MTASAIRSPKPDFLNYTHTNVKHMRCLQDFCACHPSSEA